MLQKRYYLKLETRYIKTVFRNGINDTFCITRVCFGFWAKLKKTAIFSQATQGFSKIDDTTRDHHTKQFDISTKLLADFPLVLTRACS